MPDGQQSGVRFLGLGIEFAVTIVGLSLAGLWLDRRFGFGPWGVISGLFAGLIVATYHLIRTVTAAARDEEE